MLNASTTLLATAESYIECLTSDSDTIIQLNFGCAVEGCRRKQATSEALRTNNNLVRPMHLASARTFSLTNGLLSTL